ncbi:MAG: fructosamine kinase family protein, partial [Catalinimonas sp.]
MLDHDPAPLPRPDDPRAFFEAVLFQSSGQEMELQDFQFLGSGRATQTVRLRGKKRPFFLKWREVAPTNTLSKEAQGLQLLAETGLVRVPEVLGVGRVAEKHFLLLEWIAERPPPPA